MDYYHQLCDGCQKPLLEGEDIVVCPDCGTPQHRACFEANQACVNAQKHGTGFVWKDDTLPAPAVAQNKFTCPVCGAVNPAEGAECVRCGQRFQARQEPPRARTAPDRKDIRSLFPELPQESDEESLDDEQFEMLCANLLARADMAAPGMTESQRQETVAGHPIRQVMTFVTNKPLVYVKKFRALATRRFTWNWAAFFFQPFWFFYRKLYKPGIIFLTIQMALTLLIQPYLEPIMDLSERLQEKMAQASSDAAATALMQQFYADISPHLPWIGVSLGATLLLHIAAGLLADRLYCSHVHRTLDEVKKCETRESFLITFVRRGSVSFLALVVSYAAVYFLPGLLSMLF
ncbi:MAG: DUF2628 domain-containing protein [Clostridia bacterium]|nr:DUF2628 domain-containing protein [Clostridia bacterium]MBR3551885.1 DUF2628 domain-containing protein [Clostridia bacterium]